MKRANYEQTQASKNCRDAVLKRFRSHEITPAETQRELKNCAGTTDPRAGSI